MSAPEGYRYDVFVSYRRNRFSLKWIAEEFIGLFEERLEAELGKKPGIFWDHQTVNDGEVPTIMVMEALRTSRCLLSILSKPYFESSWCAAEWETFKQRAATVGLRGRTLTIPIQWQDGEDYLPLITGHGPRPRDFSRFRLTGPGFRFSATHVEYQVELNELVESVARLIGAAPPFDGAWPLVDPSTIQIGQSDSGGNWPYKLALDPGTAGKP